MPNVPTDPAADREDDVFKAIEVVAERVVDDPRIPLVIPCDFGFFAHYDAPGRPRIYEYRHVDSRRWFQITETGRVARYVPPTDDIGLGHYVLTRRSLRTAIEGLELREFSEPRPLEEYCEMCQQLILRRRDTRPLRAVT